MKNNRNDWLPVHIYARCVKRQKLPQEVKAAGPTSLILRNQIALTAWEKSTSYNTYWKNQCFDYMNECDCLLRMKVLLLLTSSDADAIRQQWIIVSPTNTCFYIFSRPLLSECIRSMPKRTKSLHISVEKGPFVEWLCKYRSIIV